MLEVYSLEKHINDFFDSQASVSRQQCDEVARSIVGAPIEPTAIQGSFSYTVTAGATPSKIVQFRAQKSLFDMEMLALARDVHPDTVPAVTFHGTLGDGATKPLYVYLMEKAPGIVYMEEKCCDESTVEASAKANARRFVTIGDFAKFFAEDWKCRQPLPPEKIESLRLQHNNDLELLSRSLPTHFASTLQQLCAQLSLIYDYAYPTVLTHDDLGEMNILVDPQTGNITGIIDWADAKILPFGVALWSLLNVTGWMDQAGWHYSPNWRELEKEFWEIFEELVGGLSETEKRAIRLSSTIGIFMRYGFRWDESVGRRPVNDSDASLRYLEAFFNDGETAMNSIILR